MVVVVVIFTAGRGRGRGRAHTGWMDELMERFILWVCYEGVDFLDKTRWDGMGWDGMGESQDR